uniref:Uncharacterized protein LOC111103929 n=1 Tax=Crassostrea virginica TaxID=6565 RepID=A0A8B8AQ06_CRAVI|nr:uncharacterized protein LOC111103929 [Crassostrea virginica]XP_022293275.1 uncharacterized protein LOC111103929 [Crassostrea virginica]
MCIIDAAVSIDYQTHDNHTTTLTDIYGASSMSEANCKHQCSQDSRCKSFVIFENNVGKATCGFSETREYFPAVNCQVCSVHLKECDSVSVTYTEFSPGYIGSQQYANYDSLNYNHCEKTCTSDPLCNGFIYNSATSTAVSRPQVLKSLTVKTTISHFIERNVRQAVQYMEKFCEYIEHLFQYF